MVDGDAPQRPITNDLSGQAGKTDTWNRLGDDDTGQLLHKATDASIFEADVFQPLVLCIPTLERHPLHATAIGPLQRVAEQVPLNLPTFTAKIRSGHPFDPKWQRMTA